MCGIFGAIGRDINPSIVTALAALNQSRGRDSLGFATVRGAGDVRVWKRVGEPCDLLATRAFQKQRRAWVDAWAILGHTRYGTRGKNVERNAHPFAYGGIVGAHNGIVDAPASYEVDSQVIFDRLAQHDGNYQAALADLGGHWGIWWHHRGRVTLQAHEQQLARAFHCGAWYFSSDAQHLGAALAIGGKPKIHKFTSGETIAIDPQGRACQLVDFVSSAPERWRKPQRVVSHSAWQFDDVKYLPSKYRALPAPDDAAHEAYSDDELSEIYDRLLASADVASDELAALVEYGWVLPEECDELVSQGADDLADWRDYLTDEVVDAEDRLWSDHINRD